MANTPTWIGGLVNLAMRGVAPMRRDQRTSVRGGYMPSRQMHALALAKNAKRGAMLNKRARVGHRNQRLPFTPPEDWYEPTEADEYRFVIQEPGQGYRHVLTPDEVRQRLAELPAHFLDGLEVIQFSRMTQKKQSFPCYGMQWGASLYLYPIEQNLVEYYDRPPKPAQANEARMYGGRWVQQGANWKLVWTERAIRDFYLNNILIHELGHLVDDRNTRYDERERYAEWFAMHYGYRATRHLRGAYRKNVTRRHHKTRG